MMIRAMVMLVVLCAGSVALAQEPSGCDKFKFELGDAPLIVQVTGVASDSIAIAILPSE